jgi:radical SAM superfamily enzyme YgiQ (UPF0313 family)
MRVALLHAPYAETYGPLKSASGRYFPLGLGYIGAVLKGAGHEVLFLDPETRSMPPEAVKKALQEFGPQLAGVSCATPSFPGARKLAGLVREAVPGCPTIIGGVHASAFPKQVLEEAPEFDMACSGEGEYLMLDLASALTDNRKLTTDNLSSITGLTWRNNGTIVQNPTRAWISDLDSIPLPAREMADPDLYRPHAHNRRGKRATTIISSRGCPYSCVFCASHVALGRQFRAHSPKYVADEIEFLSTKMGVDQLIFNDDTFTMDPKRVRGICEEILRRGLKVSWFCFARANTVNPELLALMKKAGCFSVGFGVETGDAEILKAIKKNETLEDLRKGVEWANEAGIKTQCFFVFGNPGETAETVEKTIKFAIELKPTLAFFNMMVPYPGTEMFDQHYGKGPGASGYRWEDWVAVGPRATINIPGIPSLEKVVAEANRRFYFRPSQVWRYVRHAGSVLEVLQAVRGAVALGFQIVFWKITGKARKD